MHCFRRGDGKLLWTAKAPPTPPEPGVRDKNGFATSTPVTDGQVVISFLGSCGLLCHDFEGNLLWRHDLKIGTMHGTGSSPILYKDTVILAQDQNQNDSIFLALDKKTGLVAWKAKRRAARPGARRCWSASAIATKCFWPAPKQSKATIRQPARNYGPSAGRRTRSYR